MNINKTNEIPVVIQYFYTIVLSTFIVVSLITQIPSESIIGVLHYDKTHLGKNYIFKSYIYEELK